MDSTLVSLSILQANYSQRIGYLSNFVPFVAEALRRRRPPGVTDGYMQTALLEEFSLEMPQGVVSQLLERAQREGYVASEDGVLVPVFERIDGSQFQATHDTMVREFERLVDALVEFAQPINKREHEPEWDRQDADGALRDFLLAYSIELADVEGRGTVIPKQPRRERYQRFLVGRFVRHLVESKSDLLGILGRWAKGIVIANAVLLPHSWHADQKFKDTCVYLDTEFLIQLQGYEGPELQKPCTELIAMLRESGAKIGYLPHTEQEVRSSLEAAAHCMRTGSTGKPASRQLLRHFRTKGWTHDKLRLEVIRLADSLKSKGVVPLPQPHGTGLGSSKAQFDEHLQSVVGYFSEDSRRFDVRSVDAVLAQRAGHETARIEECRAVFVTTNRRLASAVRSFFGNDVHLVIYPCLSDSATATLIWLKHPNLSADLPVDRFVADCYAATQPSQELWAKWCDAVEKAQQEDTITVEEAHLLLLDQEARDILMEETMADAALYTAGTLDQVRARHVAYLTSDHQHELDERESRAATAERDLKAAVTTGQVKTEAAEIAQNDQAQALARNEAHMAAALLGCLLLAIVLAPILDLKIVPQGIRDFFTGVAWVKAVLDSVCGGISLFAVYGFWRWVYAKRLGHHREALAARYREAEAKAHQKLADEEDNTQAAP